MSIGPEGFDGLVNSENLELLVVLGDGRLGVLGWLESFAIESPLGSPPSLGPVRLGSW